MESKDQVYEMDICGRTIRYKFNHCQTHLLFQDYLIRSEAACADINVSPDFMNENHWLVSDSSPFPFWEFQTVMLATGNYLLQYGCALFHSASFIWKDRAWILTAPSGTGKTTQLKNWIKLYAEETQIMNGDKTGLACRADGSVYAYSTPWQGKERIGFKGKSAKLGGIILLRQGETNSMSILSPSEAVYPLFVEFMSLPETVQQIHDLRDILEQMIDAVPVWKATNLGDIDSTALIHQTLSDYLQSGEM